MSIQCQLQRASHTVARSMWPDISARRPHLACCLLPGPGGIYPPARQSKNENPLIERKSSHLHFSFFKFLFLLRIFGNFLYFDWFLCGFSCLYIFVFAKKWFYRKCIFLSASLFELFRGNFSYMAPGFRKYGYMCAWPWCTTIFSLVGLGGGNSSSM